MIGVCVVFLCITVLSTGLRVFTRLRLVRWVGADDVLILCASAAAIVEGVSAVMGMFSVKPIPADMLLTVISYEIWTWSTHRGAATGMAKTICDGRLVSFYGLLDLCNVCEVISPGFLPQIVTESNLSTHDIHRDIYLR